MQGVIAGRGMEDSWLFVVEGWKIVQGVIAGRGMEDSLGVIARLL